MRRPKKQHIRVLIAFVPSTVEDLQQTLKKQELKESDDTHAEEEDDTSTEESMSDVSETSSSNLPSLLPAAKKLTTTEAISMATMLTIHNPAKNPYFPVADVIWQFYRDKQKTVGFLSKLFRGEEWEYDLSSFKRVIPIEGLPHEMCLYIWRFLCLKDLAIVSRVSKRWYYFSRPFMMATLSKMTFKKDFEHRKLVDIGRTPWIKMKSKRKMRNVHFAICTFQIKTAKITQAATKAIDYADTVIFIIERPDEESFNKMINFYKAFCESKEYYLKIPAIIYTDKNENDNQFKKVKELRDSSEISEDILVTSNVNEIIVDLTKKIDINNRVGKGQSETFCHKLKRKESIIVGCITIPCIFGLMIALFVAPGIYVLLDGLDPSSIGFAAFFFFGAIVTITICMFLMIRLCGEWYQERQGTTPRYRRTCLSGYDGCC